MMRRYFGVAAALVLSACATTLPTAPSPPIEVQILAINDFHGNLETPAESVAIAQPDGTTLNSRVGGAAQLAAALTYAREGHRNTITVAAGDLIGASPLTSAYFLDEPTIDAMNLAGLSLASVGNHEFDKGSGELLRMQNGGCDKYTTRVPCRLEPFKGAHFEYLAANVFRGDGTTIFPATAIRQVGPVKIGFIGMTLKDTGILVTPAGVAGLQFADEAATANALVPGLKAAGADAIVLLIHEGGKLPETYAEQGCNGLSGGILPILDRLDPVILTVVSGHTHNAYACELDKGGARRLLTSAGKYGYLYTDIRLSFDPASRRLLAQHSVNVPVTGAGGVNATVAALVKRYSDAAAPAARRVVGHLSGPASKAETDGESPAANLVADAQLAATKSADRGGADISFTNTSGVRTDLIPLPNGDVTYGQIFALQPFGNNLVVKTLSGAQLKALLEQQFGPGPGTATIKSLLDPSANFRFSYDLDRPDGQRIQSMLLNGKAIEPAGRYRVSVNNFLASGGDGFSVFNQGTDAFDAGLDLDALEAWLATNPTAPAVGRTLDLTKP
jgi:5'-nucleotidase